MDLMPRALVLLLFYELVTHLTDSFSSITISSILLLRSSGNILKMLLVLLIVSSSADSFLGLDIAGLGESHLGKEGTDYLVDEHGKEGYRLNELAGSRTE